MKEQLNQFRSQAGGVYSTSTSNTAVTKYDTLKRELNSKSSDLVGVLHASLIHANNNPSKV